MIDKLKLLIRLLFPFGLNYLLFKWIYSSSEGNEFALSNTLFYVGIISLLYGVAAIIFYFDRQPFYIKNSGAGALNLAIAEQNVKNYHRKKSLKISKFSITSTHIKIIYIVIGIILCISAIFAT